MEPFDEDAMRAMKNDGSLRQADVNVIVHHREEGKICTSWRNNTSWRSERGGYATCVFRNRCFDDAVAANVEMTPEPFLIIFCCSTRRRLPRLYCTEFGPMVGHLNQR